MANQTQIQTNAIISEDWLGGYKLEVELTPESNLSDWQLDFNLPHSVREVYGVELSDNGNGSYSISGENNQTSLNSGQTIKAIFIIDGSSAEASIPHLPNA